MPTEGLNNDFLENLLHIHVCGHVLVTKIYLRGDFQPYFVPKDSIQETFGMCRNDIEYIVFVFHR